MRRASSAFVMCAAELWYSSTFAAASAGTVTGRASCRGLAGRWNVPLAGDQIRQHGHQQVLRHGIGVRRIVAMRRMSKVRELNEDSPFRIGLKKRRIGRRFLFPRRSASIVPSSPAISLARLPRSFPAWRGMKLVLPASRILVYASLVEPRARLTQQELQPAGFQEFQGKLVDEGQRQWSPLALADQDIRSAPDKGKPLAGILRFLPLEDDRVRARGDADDAGSALGSPCSG